MHGGRTWVLADRELRWPRRPADIRQGLGALPGQHLLHTLRLRCDCRRSLLFLELMEVHCALVCFRPHQSMAWLWIWARHVAQLLGVLGIYVVFISVLR